MNERHVPAERSDDREDLDAAALSDPKGGGEPPRLGPRPLDRPAVDPAAASLFGRPAGVDSGFAAPRNGSSASSSHASPTSLAAPPPAALASAFGRPDPAGAALQRPPVGGGDGAK